MSRVLSLVSGAYMPAVVSWRGVLSTHFLWCYWLASSRTKMRQPPLRSTYYDATEPHFTTIPGFPRRSRGRECRRSVALAI
ncbi:hypothetical protein CTAM01_09253 [Colletotrichum tamarilloi]|uniref:Secreted protein n=1 Tax=Colletotrichum tamarilloi TaxID=1209934 RepID=A0ABQ9R3K0_9PEZI|nr:uncharacterized protein CTAM01_09253 [Colletotrichum tamarilloi]KAK1493792.1 hypothetical protein CTAM01_09253 [Colletotrichum tamarilloi]